MPPPRGKNRPPESLNRPPESQESDDDFIVDAFEATIARARTKRAASEARGLASDAAPSAADLKYLRSVGVPADVIAAIETREEFARVKFAHVDKATEDQIRYLEKNGYDDEVRRERTHVSSRRLIFLRWFCRTRRGKGRG